MGDMGSAAVWRTAGGGSVLGEPVTGGVCGTGGAREGDSTEPDTVGVSAADAGGGSQRREGRERGMEVAAGDLWRGGTGISEFTEVDETISGEAGTGEYVRNHGDDGACDQP